MSASTELPVALVTGATRGIGRAIARELAHDHRLIVGGRGQEALAALAADLPSAQTMAVDLTDHAAVERAASQLDLPDGLAGLVHSAGVSISGAVDELTVDDWTRSFAVNVTAIAELTRLLLPALRRARGTVVSINSGSGFTARASNASYAASKFALRALTDSLRESERQHGVRVVSLHPGQVDTDMQRELHAYHQAEYQPDKYLRPESVAQTAGLALRLPGDANIDTVSVRPR